MIVSRDRPSACRTSAQDERLSDRRPRLPATTASPTSPAASASRTRSTCPRCCARPPSAEVEGEHRPRRSVLLRLADHDRRHRRPRDGGGARSCSWRSRATRPTRSKYFGLPDGRTVVMGSAHRALRPAALSRGSRARPPRSPPGAPAPADARRGRSALRARGGRAFSCTMRLCSTLARSASGVVSPRWRSGRRRSAATRSTGGSGHSRISSTNVRSGPSSSVRLRVDDLAPALPRREHDEHHRARWSSGNQPPCSTFGQRWRRRRPGRR